MMVPLVSVPGFKWDDEDVLDASFADGMVDDETGFSYKV